MYFTYWDDLGTTPARVNRFTGEIQINNRYFDNMPEFFQDFVIEHEKGHFLTNTRSEFKADRYAFDKLAGTQPHSLKNSVFSISKVLSFKNPEHMERMIAMIKMALEYDIKNNGNQKAKTALDQLNSMIESNKLNNYYMTNSKENSYFEPKFAVSEYGDFYDNAGGRAKRQARRSVRKVNHQAKHQNRVNKRIQKKQSRNTGLIANQPNSYYPVDDNSTMQDTQSMYPQDTNYPQANAGYPQDINSEPADTGIMPDDNNYDQNDFDSNDQETESFFGENGECLDMSYYNEVYDNGAGRDRRNAKKDAKQKKMELKNDRLDSKNKLRLSKGSSKETKAQAKVELAKQGKSSSDWIGGAVNGVLGLFGGGKNKAPDGTEISSDPSTVVTDDNSGKLLGMPKGVAIAVIVVVVLSVIGGVIYFIKRKKK